MINLQHCNSSGAILWIQEVQKYYEHFVEEEMRVLENKVKILWDFSIQTETNIRHKSDLILLEKKQICCIVDIACTSDPQIKEKEKDKVKNYTDLKYEILNIWKNEIPQVDIFVVLMGALGMVSKNTGFDLTF